MATAEKRPLTHGAAQKRLLRVSGQLPESRPGRREVRGRPEVLGYTSREPGRLRDGETMRPKSVRQGDGRLGDGEIRRRGSQRLVGDEHMGRNDATMSCVMHASTTLSPKDHSR